MIENYSRIEYSRIGCVHKGSVHLSYGTGDKASKRMAKRNTWQITALQITLVLWTSCTQRNSVRHSSTQSNQSSKNIERHLVAIELYGTKQISQSQLMDCCGAELSALGNGLMLGKQMDPEPVLAKIRALGSFAEVTPDFVGFPRKGGVDYYLTIDVVDRSDPRSHIQFRGPFTRHFVDPDDLIADWNRYETMINRMNSTGATNYKDSVTCPAFHCLGDDRDPAVRGLADRMFAAAPSHAEELAAIALNDADGDHRAAAVYLLAMSKDVDLLLTTLSATMRDSNMLVRNNSIRVLSSIVWFHPEVEAQVAVNAILDALEFPTALDRNKAAAVLDGILARRQVSAAEKAHIVRRSGPTLIAMLRLRLPNNHQFAHTILVKLAGRDLGEHNYDAWEHWIAGHSEGND